MLHPDVPFPGETFKSDICHEMIFEKTDSILQQAVELSTTRQNGNSY